MVIIRSGKQEDIPEIVELWMQMINEIHPDWIPDFNSQQALIQNFFKLNIYHVVIAETENRLVGFINGLVYYEPAMSKTIGLAQYFYIVPEYRKSNIALRLIKRLLKIAKEKGVQVIELQAMPGVKKSYQKIGFRTEQYVMRKVV
ncbi:MAG: GNAT family N-acetyltransferase [Caldisericaceae bacterium]|nr:GNAT family N-acetyltransferase [Caldisericaceae bacterium]